jgi:methylmalonyl-CoA mutase N-terminal domain/subunit
VISTPDYSALERDQVERVRTVRRERDAARADAALAALRDSSRTYVAAGAARAPLMELIVDAVRARASVGEIADSLRSEWGTHRPT